MSEYRNDPLTGRWVIIAEERANRPNQFDIVQESACPEKTLKNRCDKELGSENCPFCWGNEAETPSEVDAIRPFNSPVNSENWEARVVPNRYPAVNSRDRAVEDEHFWENYQIIDTDDSLFAFGIPLDGVGKHEVIIETSRHLFSVSEFNEKEIINMFLMYRQRLQALRNETCWAHALIFKNVGAAAGASLPHTHSQLLAMPFVPPTILRELEMSLQYLGKKNRCYWCDMVQFEINHHQHNIENKQSSLSRVVFDTENFLLLCPFASRFPMEVTVIPKWHLSHFELLDDKKLRELAFFVQKAVILLEKTVYWIKGELAYNIILKSGPFKTNQLDNLPQASGTKAEDAYHFYLTIMPSLAKAAGFEWGTGLHINPISPETAAAQLRQNL